jgi:hypothetical protein
LISGICALSVGIQLMSWGHGLANDILQLEAVAAHPVNVLGGMCSLMSSCN